ncbi:MAG: NADPH:quinone reductase [Verrucomicrobia bacterium]|nr:NADPH:quinone reductase [Verrucomicrobiota bacterium]
MKSIRVHQHGGPEVLKLEDVPAPSPGAGQVLVRVHAIGVNPVETYVRAGNYARKDPLPYTPGSDAAGVVQAIGSGVKKFKVGARAYIYGSVTGTYAELALCAESQVFPLPAGTTYQQGAALGVPFATAHRALFHRGGAKRGETVLIHGASGGVGHAAVQLARAAGLTVIGTGGTEAGRKFVAAQGANHVLDHRAPDYLAAVMQLTAGRGADLIIEMLANVNLGKDLGVLAKSGRVVVVGSRGPAEINPRDTMLRDADIRGMTLFNTPDADLAAIHAALQAGLADGSLRPVIGQEFKLADAPRAHEAVMQDGKLGKIILVP